MHVEESCIDDPGVDTWRWGETVFAQDSEMFRATLGVATIP